MQGECIFVLFFVHLFNFPENAHFCAVFFSHAFPPRVPAHFLCFFFEAGRIPPPPAHEIRTEELENLPHGTQSAKVVFPLYRLPPFQ